MRMSVDNEPTFEEDRAISSPVETKNSLSQLELARATANRVRALKKLKSSSASKAIALRITPTQELAYLSLFPILITLKSQATYQTQKIKIPHCRRHRAISFFYWSSQQ